MSYIFYELKWPITMTVYDFILTLREQINSTRPKANGVLTDFRLKKTKTLFRKELCKLRGFR